MKHWLAKSEPEVFSIDDLAKAPKKTTCWDGVRNFQARNFLRAMQKGDLVLFYHSSADPPGVAGVAEVVREAYADPTQFDARDPHFEPRATRDEPVWSAVDVRLVRKLARFVPIDALRAEKALAGLGVLRRGNRLSVMPVTEAEFEAIVKLGSRNGD